MNEDVDLEHTRITVRASRVYSKIEVKSAIRIQRWWNGVKDKRLFAIIKAAICSAEHSVTHEILRKLIPREAGLLQDRIFQPKVRFRLEGANFPPVIVFKVFMECNSIKYMSGKSVIQPSIEASEDARRQMGNRIYFDQMLQDACQHHQLEITDVIDVTTIKDYMKYKSGLDESPAYLGGRENYWRQLTLDVLPRHTMMHNVVEFLSDTGPARPLSMDTMRMLSRPSTQTVQVENIRTVSSMSGKRHPTASTSKITRLKGKVTPEERSRKHLARRRAEKMRLNYTVHPDTGDTKDDSQTLSAMSNESDIEDIDDMDAMALYEWTQELSFEELK